MAICQKADSVSDVWWLFNDGDGAGDVYDGGDGVDIGDGCEVGDGGGPNAGRSGPTNGYLSEGWCSKWCMVDLMVCLLW